MSGGNNDGGAASRLSTLMRASPVVLYTMAPDEFGSMTWVSDNMVAVTGWPGELVADDPHWLEHNIHPDDYAVVTEALTAWVAAGAAERLQIEYRQRTRDGEWRWYEDQVAAVRDDSGSVVELVGSIQDITARKSAERDRDRLLSILEATPDFISMAKPDGAITYINRGGLVTLGLDPSRTGLDQPLPDEARANLRTAEFESGARLEVGELPWVLGDAGQLSRLFQNLIGNALKYRHAEVGPRITITAELADSEWLIRVADNGIGIDPIQTDRVFQVFQRLHGRDEYEGNGLGLALAQRIVARHGGSIGVESAGEGCGSTFWLTLQAVDGASAP